MINYLIQINQSSLSYQLIKLHLNSFQTDEIKSIFHLRIVSIFLNQDHHLDPIKSHLAYATSLSRENSLIKFECELHSARLLFHQSNFLKSFNLFSQLLSNLNHSHSHHDDDLKTYLINMKLISAIMLPPYLRKSHLINLNQFIHQSNLSKLQEFYQLILSNSIIIPNSKQYQSLTTLLPPSLISNGTFLNSIRLHNLYSESLKSNQISSDQLLISLHFLQSDQIQSFFNQRHQLDRFKTKLIHSTPPNQTFHVQFTPHDHEDELSLPNRIQLIRNLLKQLSPSSLSLHSKPKLEDEDDQSIIHINTISSDRSENESDQPILIEPDLAEPEKRVDLKPILKKEGVWKELCESSATVKESEQALQIIKSKRKKLNHTKSTPERISKEASVFTSRLETYLNFFNESLSPLSGWPITGLKVLVWKRFNEMSLNQFERYLNVFEFAKEATLKLFEKKLAELDRLRLRESMKGFEDRYGRFRLKFIERKGKRDEIKKDFKKLVGRSGFKKRVMSESGDDEENGLEGFDQEGSSRDLRKRRQKVKYSNVLDSDDDDDHHH
ncbi:hypothetical protein DFH28DRAFT_963270, partial [Melampsora americana]